MRKRLKNGAAALLAAVLTLALGACADKPLSQRTDTAETTAAQTASDPDAALVKDGVCLWRVVRPEVCGDDVLLAAHSIDVHLYNRFAVHVESKNDLAAPTEKEILVGLTNRPESLEVFSTLDKNRYAVREVNGKIVLIGENDLATAKAVEVFLSGWVDSAAKPSEGEKAQIPMSIGEGRSGLGPLA